MLIIIIIYHNLLFFLEYPVSVTIYYQIILECPVSVATCYQIIANVSQYVCCVTIVIPLPLTIVIPLPLPIFIPLQYFNEMVEITNVNASQLN